MQAPSSNNVPSMAVQCLRDVAGQSGSQDQKLEAAVKKHTNQTTVTSNEYLQFAKAIVSEAASGKVQTKDIGLIATLESKISIADPEVAKKIYNVCLKALVPAAEQRLTAISEKLGITAADTRWDTFMYYVAKLLGQWVSGIMQRANKQSLALQYFEMANRNRTTPLSSEETELLLNQCLTLASLDVDHAKLMEKLSKCKKPEVIINRILSSLLEQPTAPIKDLMLETEPARVTTYNFAKMIKVNQQDVMDAIAALEEVQDMDAFISDIQSNRIPSKGGAFVKNLANNQKHWMNIGAKLLEQDPTTATSRLLKKHQAPYPVPEMPSPRESRRTTPTTLTPPPSPTGRGGKMTTSQLAQMQKDLKELDLDPAALATEFAKPGQEKAIMAAIQYYRFLQVMESPDLGAAQNKVKRTAKFNKCLALAHLTDGLDITENLRQNPEHAHVIVNALLACIDDPKTTPMSDAKYEHLQRALGILMQMSDKSNLALCLHPRIEEGRKPTAEVSTTQFIQELQQAKRAT